MFNPIIPGAPVFLSRKQAAQFTRLTPQYLALMAMNSEGPAFYKRSGKSARVLYKLADLVEWMESGRQEPATAAAK